MFLYSYNHDITRRSHTKVYITNRTSGLLSNIDLFNLAIARTLFFGSAFYQTYPCSPLNVCNCVEFSNQALKLGFYAMSS